MSDHPLFFDSDRLLRSGRLCAALGPGPRLRDLCLDQTVVLDSIYLTARDTRWETLEPRLVDQVLTDDDGASTVRQRWQWDDGVRRLDANLFIEVTRNVDVSTGEGHGAG